MTDQMFVFLCNDVRKYAFDYRRGDLADVEKRKFEEHVDACESCRDYVNRLEGMLDAAAISSFGNDVDRDALFDRIVSAATTETVEPTESEAPLDKNDLFSRITSELGKVDGPSEQDDPTVSNEQGSKPGPVELGQYADVAANDDETPTSTGRPRVGLYVVAALAAGVLIGFFAPRFFGNESRQQPTNLVAERDREQTIPEEKLAPANNAPPELALDELRPQPTPSDVADVAVFGEPKADWKLRRQGIRKQIELNAGTVLVEFVPDTESELEVVSDRFTVRVTGTVFYASADEGVVGVVTGSVEVDTQDGDTIHLVDGQEWVVDGGLRQAPKSTREDATRLVDPIEHQRRLTIARAEAETTSAKTEPAPVTKTSPPRRPSAKKPKPSTEVVETPRAELRASADAALRQGRYDVAAQYYERMVEELSAADPANATLRLDLARIYIRRLDHPGRAIVHLRRFVQDRPDDPATPSAKSELCRIANQVGSTEPMCAP